MHRRPVGARTTASLPREGPTAAALPLALALQVVAADPARDACDTRRRKTAS
jgi:hypothetical protein